MNDNRRAFERFGADMVFWLRRADDEDGAFKPFDIKNISGGGILALTQEPFEQGCEVITSFELPQHTDLIEAVAQIRHVEKLEDHYEIGLQFTRVKGLPVSLLIDYLEELFK